MKPVFEIQTIRRRLTSHIPSRNKNPVHTKQISKQRTNPTNSNKKERLPVILHVSNLCSIEVNLASPGSIWIPFVGSVCKRIREQITRND